MNMPKFQDLRGRKFDELKPIEYLGKQGWKCKCSCGKEIVVSNYSLVNGRVTSCGHELVQKDPNLLNVKFGKLIVIKPLGNDMWLCKCACGNTEAIDGIKLRRKEIKHCSDKSKHGRPNYVGKPRMDLTDKEFGEWKVLGYYGDGKWECKCSCGKIGYISTFDLTNNKSKSCGHDTTTFQDLKGKTFGELKVLDRNEDGTWKCQCSCGRIVDKDGKYLRNGDTTTCGHKTEFKDLTNKTFGEWEVLEYAGDSMWKCRCSCGVEKLVSRYTLLCGASTSCGHSRREHILGKDFGFLHVEKYLGNRMYECKCVCGKHIQIFGGNLTNNNIRSCGCKTHELLNSTMMERYGENNTRRINNPRDKWQIDTLNDRSAFLNMLVDFINKTNRKPTATDISKLLDVHRKVIVIKASEYHLAHYLDDTSGVSEQEIILRNYIINLCTKYGYNVQFNNRSILKGQEIDIYIPDIKTGIEFNGSYWHSDDFKDKRYHINKTIECLKNGVRLVHIFDYEYSGCDNSATELFLEDLINPNKYRINARDCSVKEISSTDTKNFLNKYHIQGYIPSKVNIGLLYKEELIGLMTFGDPRFSNYTEYELIRLAWKSGVLVNGGSEKMFKYFIKKYKPQSIVSYCDISKFTGKVYSRLGFKYDGMSEPNYKWVNTYTGEILTRYQTMKSDLVKNGFGTIEQTGDEIMKSRHFCKVYDCGNARYIWEDAH